MRKFFENKYFAYILIFFSIALVYSKLPYGFFEQDEWHSFGNYLYLQTLSPLDFVKSLLSSGPFTHFTPLSTLTKMLMFNLFKLNATPYFVISLLLHFLVSVQVFKIILNLTKNKWESLLGSLFFAINASHFQAVTWLGTFEGVELSTLFGLLAINSYFEYKNVYKISLFILLSLLYKEIGFIFLGIIIFLMIYEKSKLKNYLNIIFIGLIYIFFKFSYIFLGVLAKPAVITTGIYDGINIIIYNASTLIPKLISISIFSDSLIKIISNFFLPQIEPFLPDLNKIWLNHLDMVYDLTSSIIGLLLFILITLSMWKKYRKEYFISILFIIFSTILIIPLKRYLIYPDSRYLYTITIGVSIIISTLLTTTKKILQIFLYILSIVLIGLNANFLYREVETQVRLGIIRKNILNQINSYLPLLTNKTVIYTESNKSYFGFGREIFPFQNGIGHIFLINYSLNQNIPIEFIKNDHFWNVDYQGFENYNNFGFGYFYNLDKLRDEIKKGEISINDIYAFSFIARDNTTLDITKRIRDELFLEKFTYKEINPSNITITPSINTTDINMIKDRDRKTFWSTNSPYKLSQYLKIDLNVSKKIVKIELDSYNNKDQDKIGYLVSTSTNGIDWEVKFRDDLRSPNKDGIVNIYLQNDPIRYIRIQQIGYHDFASWVVHEIKLYETVD